jgi:putative hydrolase of the HAD superfamily
LKNFTEHQVSRDQIKNIIFDLGGVVINIDWQLTVEAFQQLADPAYRDQNEDLIQKGTYKAQFFEDYEVGAISDAVFFQHLRDTFHLQATDAQIADAWNALLQDIPQARLDMIKKLGETHRTFILSNTNAVHIAEAANILQRENGVADFDDLVEKAYYSHIMQKRKPWASIYQQVIEENNLKPEETLFIDDGEANIIAATEVGLQGLHVVANLNGWQQFFEETLV